MSAMALVRYVATAAEAAGTAAEQVPASTVGELRAQVLARHGGELAQLIGGCAFVVDGVISDDGARLGQSDVVDVVPG
ncbi:MoaD/ThiS family protein [uncultured Cellulomonas sp.]|uniref:MoaD/ThiS family protein n=1 Tax=uncultured Cellulomonas sp. TaxID=189682 RepID=UPI0028EAA959|nr:MoaD/ThiS family protein [uncultured Cellulomonas sp.]